jgi:hypothetical protein
MRESNLSGRQMYVFVSDSFGSAKQKPGGGEGGIRNARKHIKYEWASRKVKK